ncbi:MAG: GNAT family N-acetyltransferase [Bdellovibrionota bacterium]
MGKHFENKTHDISLVRSYVTKIMMLRDAKEEDFQELKKSLDDVSSQKDYLVVRYHDRPVAFFVSQVNYKSGFVYLNWVTVSPGFQQEGLGKLVMEQLHKRYPEAAGIEVYSFGKNVGAVEFYKHCGFKIFDDFHFEKPILTLETTSALYFPSTDMTSLPHSLFVAFQKHFPKEGFGVKPKSPILRVPLAGGSARLKI